MSYEQTCAYVSNHGWPCPRPVCEIEGKRDRYCIFHSENYGPKTRAFAEEIENVKRGRPSWLFLKGKRDFVEFYWGERLQLPLYDFLGFRFPFGCSDFKKHRFEHFACFDEAVFNHDAKFQEATFAGVVRFGGVEFQGYTDFSDAVFEEAAEFCGAYFTGDCRFDRATFNKHSGFGHVTFSGWAKFRNVTFKDRVDFQSTRCENDLFFENSTVAHVLRFVDCTIRGRTWLSNIAIGSLLVDGVKYDAGFLNIVNVSFSNPDLDNHSNINGVLQRTRIIDTDLSYVSFGGAFPREIIFDRVTFDRHVDENWRLESFVKGRPSEAIFEERLARKRVSETTAREERKKKRKSLFGAAETVYRTLKHALEEEHSYNMSRRMRAGELECRLQRGPSLFEKIMLRGYRFLNGFGLRWFRALLFWLICVLAFTGIYTGKLAIGDCYDEAAGTTVAVHEPMQLHDALLHSLEMTSVIAKPSKHIDDQGMRWIELLERILSPALLLLFIQAARNAARD